METLVIMDFGTSTIDIYNIPIDAEINEEWFKKQGYDINTIYYMFAQNLNINFINK